MPEPDPSPLDPAALELARYDALEAFAAASSLD